MLFIEHVGCAIETWSFWLNRDLTLSRGSCKTNNDTHGNQMKDGRRPEFAWALQPRTSARHPQNRGKHGAPRKGKKRGWSMALPTRLDGNGEWRREQQIGLCLVASCVFEPGSSGNRHNPMKIKSQRETQNRDLSGLGAGKGATSMGHWLLFRHGGHRRSSLTLGSRSISLSLSYSSLSLNLSLGLHPPSPTLSVSPF